MGSAGACFLEPSPLATLRDQHGSRMKCLHEEVEDVSKRVSVKKEEEQRRQAALERLRRAVRELWPAATLVIFGSQATGLTLTGLSDIDVMIVGGVPDLWGPLYTLAAHLQRTGVCVGTPHVKGKARVPVVRFMEAQSRVEFDVSIEKGVQRGRLQAQKAEWMKEKVGENPTLRPLYMVLKLFMYQKELNIVYEKGGLNSYTLFVMLVAYLQMQAKETSRRGGIERLLSSLRIEGGSSHGDNLGALLEGFFHFYGNRLNTKEYGVSCRDGGCCFKKLERRVTFYHPLRPYLLAVEDPLVPTHDLGEVAYGFHDTIRPAFQEAYRSLTLSSSHPFLARIINFP